MSTAFGAPCPKCQKAPLLRFTTDGNGRHREEVIQACEHERRRRGLCRVCDAPVYGALGKAAWCAPHKKEAQRKQTLACRHRNLEKRRKADRERKREKFADPEKRAEKRARDRQRYAQNPDKVLAKERARRRWSHPKYQEGLARRRENKRRYRKKNRAKLRAYSREWRAKQRAARDAATRNAPLDRAA